MRSLTDASSYLRTSTPSIHLSIHPSIHSSIYSFIHSFIHYGDLYSAPSRLLLNIDVTQINRLQAIQNALARAVTKTPKHHHITPLLKKLHWLKIPERIKYKVISLSYNTLQSSQPSYL